MRQQLVDATVHVRGQPRQHILEVSPGIVPVELGRHDQTHHRGGPLACEFAATEELRLATHRPGPHQVLDVVVVHRQAPALQVRTLRIENSEECVDELVAERSDRRRVNGNQKS